MPEIKLPDGKKLTFEKKVSGLQIAEKISKSLAKQALIMIVDGELKDLSFLITKNSSVKIITSKDSEGLDTMRHDVSRTILNAIYYLCTYHMCHLYTKLFLVCLEAVSS